MEAKIVFLDVTKWIHFCFSQLVNLKNNMLFFNLPGFFYKMHFCYLINQIIQSAKIFSEMDFSVEKSNQNWTSIIYIWKGFNILLLSERVCSFYNYWPIVHPSLITPYVVIQCFFPMLVMHYETITKHFFTFWAKQHIYGHTLFKSIHLNQLPCFLFHFSSDVVFFPVVGRICFICNLLEYAGSTLLYFCKTCAR